jgi:hypothetical protein
MGTLTITTTTAQDQRIAKAFGRELGLGGNANATQVRNAVLAYLKGVVKKGETIDATEAAHAAIGNVAEIDVT